MLRRQFASILGALVLATSAAGALQTSAPDLTGTWTGFLIDAADSSSRDAVHMMFKQTGTELTGTAGPSVDRQWAIQKGKVATTKDGTSVTFAVQDGNNNMTLQFDMKLADGRLKGTVNAQRGDEKRSGTVDLERAK